MGERGQITIEGLLLFGAFTMIFITISFPHAMTSYTESHKVSRMQEAQMVLDKMNQTVDAALKGGSGSVRSVNVTINEDQWWMRIHSGASYEFRYVVYFIEEKYIPEPMDNGSTSFGQLTTSFSGITPTITSTICSPTDPDSGVYNIRVENNQNSIDPSLSLDCSQINSANKIVVTIQ